MASPSRLAIVAHYDSRGGAAPHFLRVLDQIGTIADQVIVSSTADLTPAAEDAISARATLFRRPNYGHDFGSWRDALERMNWAADFDELLLTNDSYVGFFRPLPEIYREMSQRPVELWGITKTARRGEHVQSYFLNFTSAALRSQTFRRFWMDAKPAPDRMTAIITQEVGVSEAFRTRGFRLGSYFEPALAERMRANVRGVHWLLRRQRAYPARYDNLTEDYFAARRFLNPAEADQLNTSSAYADSVFDNGRLPLVKLDVLRNDPFWLDSATLIDDLEKVYPDEMAGVRTYLRQMSEDYGARPYENHRYAHLAPPVKFAVGYSRRKGALSLRQATRKNSPHTDLEEGPR